MRTRTTLTALVAAATLAAAAPAHAAAPLVEELVVFKNGTAKQDDVRASKTTVRVGGKKCGVPQGSALAALLKLKPAKIGMADYGDCTGSVRDASGLYVKSIGSDRARGSNGWVYKIGRKSAPAGAADPAGPFGSGPIRAGQRVTWFYCKQKSEAEGCQRTLELDLTVAQGQLFATVRGYDDSGKGTAVSGATVATGETSVKTDDGGRATLDLGPGTYSVYASKKGLVRSFSEEATIP